MIDSSEEKLMQIIGAHERQDNIRKQVEQSAERLVAKLKPGNNYFTPDQYVSIVSYLFPNDNDKQRVAAIAKGSFSPSLSNGVKRIVIVRVKWLTEDRLVSLTDLSAKTGIPYKTLWRKVRSLNLPEKRSGNKVLYDIDMLRERLSDIPE